MSSGTENTASRGAVVGQGQHRCARRDDLAGLDVDGGDDTRRACREGGIARLVGLHARLSPRLPQAGLGSALSRHMAIELGLADEALRTQVLEALEVGSGLGGLRLGG